MDLFEMEYEMTEMRKEFRNELFKAGDNNSVVKFLKNCLDKCGSLFEEECLMENLREEFLEWVRE